MACVKFELSRSAYYEWLSNYDKHQQEAQHHSYVCQLIWGFPCYRTNKSLRNNHIK